MISRNVGVRIGMSREESEALQARAEANVEVEARDVDAVEDAEA